MNVPILLLDAAWRVDRVITSDRAVELIAGGRVVAASEELAAVYHSPSTTIEVPSVIARLGGLVGPARGLSCSHRRVRIRDHFECQFVIAGVPCRRRGDSVDHLQPRSLGGPSSWTNLVAACTTCNGTKGDTPFAVMSDRHGWSLRREPHVPSLASIILASTRPQPGWEPYLRAA